MRAAAFSAADIICTRPGTLSHPCFPSKPVKLSPPWRCMTESRLSGAFRSEACGGVFRRRHHMHTPGNTEPPLFPIKTSEAVSALEMHDRESLVRSLRINIDGKMLAAECGNRSLLHAARDFLERI